MSHFGSKQHIIDTQKKTAKSAAIVLKFIKKYHNEHGYAPSHKEIQDGCGISYVYVTKLLKSLTESNFIEYGGGSRMIKIL